MQSFIDRNADNFQHCKCCVGDVFIVSLQPVFSLRVTYTPGLTRVFSHRERKRAVWQYGRVGRKRAAPMSRPILL